MKKLTENLIQQRLKTCTTDLDKVLQINITGRELEDVSLLRQMTGVEILSLSVNRISSLSDFQFCKNLKELYLRNNNISDIRQICYLTNLPKLKLLMLSQNPCADDPLYRPTVIKNLQYLTELDGVPVSPEERQQALRTGVTLNSDSFGVLENGNNSVEVQVRRPPVQTLSCTIQESEEIETEVTEVPSSHEMVGLTSTKTSKTEFRHVDDAERSPKQPGLCEMCREKDGTQLHKREVKGLQLLNNIDKSQRQYMCKCCNDQSADSVFGIRFIPKNSNILSATLNLIKELDYSSLQIIQAELTSILNTFEVDFMCHGKK